jgi:serine/threonine protein kinase
VDRFGGNPSRGPVLRCDGTHKNDPEIGRSVPAEVVEISSLKLAEKMVQGGKLLQLPDLKIVDFGQAFIHEPKQKFKLPYNLDTPEIYRAPEILVYKTFDLDDPFAADLWSAGCAIFYIATGTAPIDTSGVSLLKAWLIALNETIPSTWIAALPLIERYCMDCIISSGHDTLDSRIAGLYRYPDKQDFANFLRLILVMRPERRANISVLLRQRWLQRSPGPLPDEPWL